MGKTEEEQGAQLLRGIGSVLLGGVISLAVCLMVLLICSFGISGGWMKEGLMYQMVISACVMGSFVGATWAVVRCGSRSLVVGLCTGVVHVLCLMTVGLLLFADVSVASGGLGLVWGSLCGGGLAGLLGTRPKKKGRKNSPNKR